MLKGNWTCIVFLLAILCFGMAEMVLVSGQITVTLMAIMFYLWGEMDILNKKVLKI